MGKEFWLVSGPGFDHMGRNLDCVGLWKLAQSRGYNPVPFCTFSTTAASAHLRSVGFTVIEPEYHPDRPPPRRKK